MAKPTIGVHSGLVRTVLGPIPVEAIGVTLMHEHILLDASSWWKRPCCGSEIAIAERPLDISMIGDLRMNPFLNRDNCGLLDVRAAIEELNHFVEYGGKTIVDPTNLGIGRDPSALQRISRRSGLNIVMGAGFYLEPSHPPYVRDMSVETIAEAIARDCGLSEDEPEVCAGIIGEIGISKDFTPAEEKVLRGAARASKLSGAPLSVHLPGWERHAHRVLDVVESEGADLRPRRALPYEPELARRRVPEKRGRQRRLHRIRYDRDGLFLRRPAGPVAMRRGERDRDLPAGRRRLPQLDPDVAGRVS